MYIDREDFLVEIVHGTTHNGNNYVFETTVASIRHEEEQEDRFIIKHVEIADDRESWTWVVDEEVMKVVDNPATPDVDESKTMWDRLLFWRNKK